MPAKAITTHALHAPLSAGANEGGNGSVPRSGGRGLDGTHRNGGIGTRLRSKGVILV